MIYLLTATGLTPDDRSTVHIYTQNNTQNNTIKQNTQNGTHITKKFIHIKISIRNLQN